MSSYLGKKYRQVSCENLENYYRQVGMTWFIRKLFVAGRPTVMLKEENGVYSLNIGNPIMKIKHDFSPGEQKHTTYPDGRQTAMVFSLEGENMLKQHQMGDIESVITYIFSDTDLRIEMRSGDVFASRTCQIVE